MPIYTLSGAISETETFTLTLADAETTTDEDNEGLILLDILVGRVESGTPYDLVDTWRELTNIVGITV